MTITSDDELLLCFRREIEIVGRVVDRNKIRKENRQHSTTGVQQKPNTAPTALRATRKLSVRGSYVRLLNGEEPVHVKCLIKTDGQIQHDCSESSCTDFV